MARLCGWAVLSLALAVTFPGLLGACAAAAFDGATVHGASGVAYRIGDVPNGWRRIEIANADLAFRDDAHEASILVNGRCTGRDSDAPLAVLVRHLMMGTTEERPLDDDPKPFALDGREALQRLLEAKLDGVVMRYDVYVLKKDGCVYDMVFLAPPEHFSAGRPAFDEFVRAFHTLPGSGVVK
jgi:hypothetical protein